MLGFRQLGDVERGVPQRDELATARRALQKMQRIKQDAMYRTRMPERADFYRPRFPGRPPGGRPPPGRLPPGRLTPGRLPPGRLIPGRLPPGRLIPGL
jgi:hypothetical protein